jgi:hypothetical protein
LARALRTGSTFLSLSSKACPATHPAPQGPAQDTVIARERHGKAEQRAGHEGDHAVRAERMPAACSGARGGRNFGEPPRAPILNIDAYPNSTDPKVI